MRNAVIANKNRVSWCGKADSAVCQEPTETEPVFPIQPRRRQGSPHIYVTIKQIDCDAPSCQGANPIAEFLANVVIWILAGKEPTGLVLSLSDPQLRASSMVCVPQKRNAISNVLQADLFV